MEGGHQYTYNVGVGKPGLKVTIEKDSVSWDGDDESGRNQTDENNIQRIEAKMKQYKFMQVAFDHHVVRLGWLFSK